MMRDGKPKGLSYLDHRTADSKYNIITDVYVTPGKINDVDVANAKDCEKCPSRAQSFYNKSKFKTFRRHMCGKHIKKML